MRNIRVFISSVQAEFAEERMLLCEYIRSDVLLGKFFVPFIFEELPANNWSAQQVYLREVEMCDVYIGLFGLDYGYEDQEGISPTEREFDMATKCCKTRLVFIKRLPGSVRHEKENRLIRKAEQTLIRKTFSSFEELRGAVYAALINYLAEKEYIRMLPFDAAFCQGATMDDLDPEKVDQFVGVALAQRGFPLERGTDMETVLTHLNLLQNGRVSNAAVLLFGKQPQRFVMGSEVKCAHFYGMEVTKPIPSYQVYKGDLFELVRQAVGFVLSRIDLSVGTRDRSIQVDTEYELPVGAVTEAIVNAIVHKDYSSYGSVQVMLFRDRLEIWNPGSLPYGLTPAKLREPHTSIPANPLLAEPMYLTGFIERMGTGTGDIVKQCIAKGLREPEFVQEEEFRVVLWRNGNLMNDEFGDKTKDKTKERTVGETVGEIVGETVGETALRILRVIEKKPNVTRKELTEIMGLSVRGIEWNLAQLKAKGFIERVGATKKGYWKINRKE